ncbi:Zinc finger, PHD-type domain containing protein [Dorcoceras hygrometricum]|uniref:Zinc finger, PHD-type domain containing protein n=1 Tax=Dorcoceras hygrometricum TaxID=472368 RepID=A0A2Z7AY96_9LAMI|nr:Zinc finger, PHD-type domain containing protein [Dorcoceras hygrometricum]
MNEFKKMVQNHGLLLTTDVADVRKGVKDQKADLFKEIDDRLATIRSDLLDFRAQALENYTNLSSQLDELVAYIHRGSDDKKGESGSSRHPQPPPDDQSRPSGNTSEQPRRRGSGGSRSGSKQKDWRYWLNG